MKRIFFAVVFITTLYNLQAQTNKKIKLDTVNYKCTYLLTYQPDSTDIKHIEQEEMLLFIGKEISEFISSGLYKQDSFKIVFNKKMKDPEFRKTGFNSNEFFAGNFPITKFNARIYKNYPKEKITVTERILMDNYRYVDYIGSFNWKIKTATKKIGNYQCQEAECYFAGRNYTAWFTNEIPLSEGPYKFSGLPGLIIVIQDSKNHYKYELLRMDKLSDSISNIEISDDKYINTNKKEFFKNKREFQKHAFDRMEDAGISFGDPLTNKEKQKAINKRNNPIELINE